jgi:hypothetical protein
MKLSIKGNVLTVELPIEPFASKSGKSLVVASTKGNQATTVEYQGKPITIGVNAYIAATTPTAPVAPAK